MSITGFLGEYHGQGGEFSVKYQLIKVVVELTKRAMIVNSTIFTLFKSSLHGIGHQPQLLQPYSVARLDLEKGSIPM